MSVHYGLGILKPKIDFQGYQARIMFLKYKGVDNLFRNYQVAWIIFLIKDTVVLSDELNMHIPHPHEFTNSLPDLLDNVGNESFLHDLAGHVISSRGRQNQIIFIFVSFVGFLHPFYKQTRNGKKTSNYLTSTTSISIWQARMVVNLYQLYLW